MDASKLLPLIGVLVFIVVLLNFNLQEIATTIAGADLLPLAMVLAIHVFIILLKAGKWKVITHAYEKPAGLIQCVHAWLVGFVIGIVTPGRIGEFSKAYYLRKTMSMGRGMATIVVDRITDITVLFTLAILGVVTFIYVYSGAISLSVMVLLIIPFMAFLLAAFLFLTRKDMVRRLARPLFSRLVPVRHKEGMRATFHEFYLGMNDIRNSANLVLISMLLTVLSWLIIIIQYSLIALSLSLSIDYLFLLSVVPIVILLDTLPISFSGLGTREVALIFFLGIIHVPAEAAISFSILIFLVNYMAFVPVGLLFWFIRPIRISQ